MTRRRANLLAFLLFVAAALVIGSIVLASTPGPQPGTAPTPTPWPCVGGGR